MTIKDSTFITFEGIEGCGKTTQAELLYQWLLDSGREVVLTREPGGTPIAEEVRRLILKSGGEYFPPFSELCLYLAARGFHVENLIKPSLDKGMWVICDRFVDSTVAYQGYGRGIDVHLIEKLNEEVTGGVKPELTFLIDVPVEVGLSRIRNRTQDRLESERINFHERVRNGFLEIARANPQRVVVVNGTGSAKEVFKTVLKTLLEKLNAV